ncbi:hypothetical protein AB7942_19255 [Neobacillus sp. BF23-41]|uniref:hypothetical protein n=1 Tax=Neobacillus sp. BF23-41 TaxID=3240280 RepID=UPI0034E4C3E8
MPKSNAAKVNQINVEGLESKATVTPFPLDVLDTYWMTKIQKKFFEVLKQRENRDKKYDELSILAGYKSYDHWYNAIKDERFVQLLENIDVQVRHYENDYPSHHEVEYIQDPKEREEYLAQDVWDVRRLFKDYPKHRDPKDYILKFYKIENVHVRKLRNVLLTPALRHISAFETGLFTGSSRSVSSFNAAKTKKHTFSESSKDKLIESLKRRLAKLEEENQKLRKDNAILLGKLANDRFGNEQINISDNEFPF